MSGLLQSIKNKITPNSESANDTEAMNQDKGVSKVIRIGKEEVTEAASTLKKYKDGKQNLESRIIENEQWWKMRHWELMRKNSSNNVEPASAWLFNSIANKHADAMDNYPEPNVLPRAKDDEESAKQLSSILPVILDQNDYEKVYSDVWWYKLKQGTGVKGIFWNPKKLNGLGDVEVKKIDLLNLFWEPGIADIQDSKNLFHIELVDTESLNGIYPEAGLNDVKTVEKAAYQYDDTVDTEGKSVVVDWYYKKYQGGREVLHYCKFVGETVLYASENEEEYAERGFYDHGKYPFVFDSLFVEEGTPAGFGYIDIMKDCQMYIDKLNSCIIENALEGSRRRYFVRDDGNINEKEYLDYTKPFVHTSGNLGDESIREIQYTPLSNIYVEIMNSKIEELKETSGNRDFSQGSTANGVTAASAISALMEAGSKLSRDMLKSSYRSFNQECYLILELVRQFYDEPRCFRITGSDNKTNFETFDNSMIKPQPQGVEFGIDLGERLPVFDIEVTAAKKSMYSRMAQNELALQFFNQGFFNPEIADQSLACIEMMDFDGKEIVVEKINQNNTMYNQLMMMQQQLQQMAQIIDAQNGSSLSAAMMQEQQQGGVQQPMGNVTQFQQQPTSLTEKAAKGAQDAASPK